MTDMEGVAGVVTLPEYCLTGPRNKYGRAEGGRYYEHGRELATLEANAAVEGLLEAGVTDVLVCDGHGPGGLNASLIHPEARILTGRGQRQPRGLDESFDLALIVGQHAMAHTDGGHLCHSGSFSREEWTLNGVEIGEIHLFALLASELNVPVVMLAGDRAACDEARRLIPSMLTVPVVEGERMGSTRGMTTDQAIDLNVPAVHLSPTRARQCIREGARQCVGLTEVVERYTVAPPYEMTRVPRRAEGEARRVAVAQGDSLAEVMSQPIAYQTA